MKKTTLFLLSLSGLFVAIGVSFLQNTPGYMDAEYYYAGGFQLASGEGFNERFIWNYLDDPNGIPHPSHAYWMPLASIIAAMGMRLIGQNTFFGARIFIYLIFACIPPLAASLAFQYSHSTRTGIFAGLLALFPGFYTSYISTTDTFVLYMCLGGGILMLAGNGVEQEFGAKFSHKLFYTAILAGILAGLMHLSRADGLIWLVIALVMVVYKVLKSVENAHRFRFFLMGIGACIMGYIIIMGPWMARNYQIFGTLLSPGGVKSLWLTNYDELYSYPASFLNFEHWWESGISAISRARLDALNLNIQTLVVVQGEIFLLPLLLVALWRRRFNIQVQLTILAWLLTIFVMTFVFPFSGSRGGFFHSGAGMQLMLWALIPDGLEGFIRWGQKKRRWNPDTAWKVFQFGCLGLVIFITGFAFFKRVIGSDVKSPIWSQGSSSYSKIKEILIRSGFDRSQDIIAVNNPPGFFISTHFKSIVIPNGNLHTLLSAMKQYNAGYVMLEYNHPRGLDGIYQNPGTADGLTLISRIDGTLLFKTNRIRP